MGRQRQCTNKQYLPTLAVFTMNRGGAGRTSPQQIVEDAIWCGKGYEVFNLCNVDTDTRAAGISLAANDSSHYWTNDSGAMRHSSSDKTRHIGITFGGEPKVPETQSDPPLKVQQFIADNGLHAYSDAS